MLLSSAIPAPDICHHWAHTSEDLFHNKLSKLLHKNISHWIQFSIWMPNKLYLTYLSSKLRLAIKIIEIKDLRLLSENSCLKKLKTLLLLWLAPGPLVVNCSKTLPWLDWALVKKEKLLLQIQTTFKIQIWIDSSYSDKSIFPNPNLEQLLLAYYLWIPISRVTSLLCWKEFLNQLKIFSQTNSLNH